VTGLVAFTVAWTLFLTGLGLLLAIQAPQRLMSKHGG